MSTLEVGIVIPDTVGELLELAGEGQAYVVLATPMADVHRIPVTLPYRPGQRTWCSDYWEVGVHATITRAYVEAPSRDDPWSGVELPISGHVLVVAPFDYVTTTVALRAEPVEPERRGWFRGWRRR